ncbi:MAG: hypothetical protein AAF218_02815 [Pseudomonadota bacterium]
MTRIFTAAMCALAIATPAIAQSGDGSQFKARFDRADKNKDGVISRAEAPRRLDFDAADGNRDGVLSLSEVQSYMLALRAQRG